MSHISAGVLAELWRYPVKSMLGEQRRELVVTTRGVLGDRAWALRDLATGRIASAKKYPRLLEFRSTYVIEPASDSRGRIVISIPDGRRVGADDPDASRIVSEALGHAVRLENQAGVDEKAAIDRETVFGDVPVSVMKPQWTDETMRDYFSLMPGTFFEVGTVFVLASGSVEHLRRLQGGTAQIDRRRFRPNIYIQADAHDEFVEDGWAGGTLAVGSVRLTNFEPTVWCVTSTLAQEELPRDLSILRTAAQHHRGCVGVYATVARPGLAQVGDAVALSKDVVAAPA